MAISLEARLAVLRRSVDVLARLNQKAVKRSTSLRPRRAWDVKWLERARRRLWLRRDWS